MLDPVELLALARDLAAAADGSTRSQVRLRRAVSTTYYALFHKVLRAAAERFMGAGEEASAGYSVLYRSFDHGHMKKTCKALGVASLGAKYARVLGMTALSQEARDFVTAFPPLQEARHMADYDPRATFLASDVASLISAAESALSAFDAIPSGEQADLLALLMVSARE